MVNKSVIEYSNKYKNSVYSGFFSTNSLQVFTDIRVNKYKKGDNKIA